MLGLIGKTLSHYKLLDQIGQGGMSSVFRAVDLRNRRAVAVKILSPYIAHEPRFRARFEREVRLLGRLQHPNIMPILDFGEAEGLAYIVMPYFASGTLSNRLAKGPIDPHEGGRIVQELSSALAAAHAAGVIHRDVKPSNILLDPLGHALLSDFSFAHQTDASQNLTGSALIGTPAYMSPEQCRGEPIDARSDQYSLAVVLYQLTTGQLPFEADTPMATALKHVNEPLPRPRLVNPGIPEEIEMVLVRALAKDPSLRFASVLELNDAFQEALRRAVDPTRRIRTASTEKTTAAYNRLQNVQPEKRPRLLGRSALAAALLLLLACPASAAGAAVFFPELLNGAAIANRAPDIQGTVSVLLTMNPPPPGANLPPGAMETAVFVAVVQTMAANGTPVEALGVDPMVLIGGPGGTPTPIVGLIFPTLLPTKTRTLAPGESPLPPSQTPVPAVSSTPGPSPTPGPSSTSVPTGFVLLTDVPDSPTVTPAPSETSAGPSPTSGATSVDTPVPPTPTSAPAATVTPHPPTNTAAPQPTDPPPPTNTPQPPDPTDPGPPDSGCGEGVPPGQCKKTQTAAAGG